MKKTIWAAIAALALTAHALHAAAPAADPASPASVASAPAPADQSALWAQYGAQKVSATAALAKLSAGSAVVADRDAAVAAFAATADSAHQLGRSDIEAWQRNNSAYAQILWFKNAGYSFQMKRLEGMAAGKDKPAAIADAKATLTPLFAQVSAGALKSLDEAKSLAGGNSAILNAVNSNHSFLVWVQDFLK